MTYLTQYGDVVSVQDHFSCNTLLLVQDIHVCREKTCGKWSVKYVVRANQSEVLSFGFRNQQVSSGAVCCVVFSSFRSGGSTFASGIIVKYAFFARLNVWYWYLVVLGHVIFHYDLIMMCVDPDMFRVTSYLTIKVLCTNAICGNFSNQYSLEYR